MLAAVGDPEWGMLGESKAVFLSYSSEDLAAAVRVAAALQAAGIEVWLDKSELRGGDAWDSMIRGKIRGCTLFVALISAHSRERAEGYFRFEWKLAVDRSYHIASDRPFLLPIVIDETAEADARVPDRFREVQWTQASGGELAQEFVDRVRRMLEGGDGAAAPAVTVLPESAKWSASVPDKSLAVMPFVNLDRDPENEYFSEGLAEEILTALTEIGELHVAARSSSFYFKGRATDLQEIARRLRVAHVLEGSVRRAANRVRVTVQLVDVRNGFQLWSERYDREMADVFAIQDEITSAIVQRLKVKLLDKKETLVADAPVDLETYNLYLKGRFHWAQRPQGIAKAIEYFKQAIDRDPNYARARAGLADCYTCLGAWESGVVPPLEAMPLALQAADKALELDSRLVEAHTSLAYRTTNYEWDWDKAEARFKHVFDLNPNYAVCHHWYSHLLVALGRTKESLKESKRCLELDPLDHLTNAHLAWHHLFSRQFEEAIEQCVKTDELNPGTFIVRYFSGLAEEQLGHVDRAVEALQMAVKLCGGVTYPTAGLGHLYGRCGKAAEARAIYDELGARAKQGYVPAYDFAIVCIGLGWKDQAFEYLSKAYDERSGWMTYLKGDARLDPLRNDTRFLDLLQRLRLPP
ncbi:MAG TPA: TIR domain-containing protein [Rhodanobacteraceae bacterium]|nr:TIR domain-containing protein [Rhodanobacteraceae bacterium]